MPPKKSIVSDDDFSDDDELVSEEEDVKPGDIKTVLKGGLPTPLYTSFNLRHLRDMCQTGGVELNPSYQRDVVWNESKMTGLIQSLFLNYYIPAVMFAVITDDLGVQTRICIDGKQRCSSIIAFFDGSIPFISPHTKEKYYYRLYGNRRSGIQLPPALKTKFDQLIIQAVEYHDISDIKQRDLFQRVQMGVSLSTAEKLQAIPGPWPQWVIALQRKYINEEKTLGDTITWDQTRGKPFQNLAGMVILAYEQDRETVPSAQAINTFFSRSDSPDDHFKRKIEMALSLFVEITVNHFAESFGVVENRVAPAEFVYSGLLIFKRMGIHPVTRLAQLIGEMRKWIRIDHKDIRTNTRVSKDFYSFIQKIPTKTRQGEQPAAEEYERDDVDPRSIRQAKRARQSESDDPTYRETATDRFDSNGLGNATRAAKQQKTMPKAIKRSPPPPNNAPRKINPLPPQPAAARPPASPMDRAWSANSAGGFGQAPQSAVNPYTQGYNQRAPQTYAQPQSAAPAPQQQQQQQYSVEQQRQYAAMHAAQQHQRQQYQGATQGNRWATQR